MTNQEIYELMTRFDASAARTLRITRKDFSIELSKVVGAAPAPQAQPAASAAPAPAERKSDGCLLTAPLVGTYYAAPSPEAEPYVKAGDRVKAGQTLCLIEAMKMMNEVAAPCDCVVEELLCADGELVAYDAPILRYRPV